MPVETVDPRRIDVSQFNERQSFDPAEMDSDAPIVKSVENVGIIEPPLVLSEDGQMAVFVGQRRVRAAQLAGKDEIPVYLMDRDDEDALKASITENVGLFSKDVTPRDRAVAIEQLWEMMGGDGTPVFSHVGKELGVPGETVRTWYEPMRDEWEGTDIDPRSDSGEAENSGGFFEGEDTLGERSLGEVRRMTDDKDVAESVAEIAASMGATQEQLKEAKALVDDTPMSPEAAVETVLDESESEDEDDTVVISVDVSFAGDTAETLAEFADREDMEYDEVAREAVMRYIGYGQATGTDTDADAESESTVKTRAGSDLL